MQDVSNPEENDELKACTEREVCGQGLAPEVNVNRTLRQKSKYTDPQEQ